MPSLYDSVGVEPTYELAESIIKATIQDLKHAIDYLNEFPNELEYTEYAIERLSYRSISRATADMPDVLSALQVIIKHFPDTLIKSNNTLYIKNSSKHLLNANDLLIVEYYYLLLNKYEDRVDKYQRQLKKQQDRQCIKVLFVILLPFIMVFFMLLVGD